MKKEYKSTPEQRAKWREKWNKKSPEKKLKKYRHDHLKRKLKFLEDPDYREKQRAQWRESAKRKRAKRGEQINERQRKIYKERAEIERVKINNNRRKRNPTIGISSFIRDVKQGRKSARELIDRLRKANDELSSLTYGKSPGRIPGK